MNIAVLFGGKSSEHEVSRSSVCNVLNLLRNEKYNVYQIGITKEGAWYLTNATLEEIKSGVVSSNSIPLKSARKVKGSSFSVASSGTADSGGAP